jgi:uncharacterized Zn-binding protein involved in type VI secretion/predicted XRE-type DNA-binding protein
MTNANIYSSPASDLGNAIDNHGREDLAKRIKILVEFNGWPQIYSAGLCGQSQPRISDILNDRLARFSMDGLFKIATVLEFYSKDFPASKRTTESVRKIIEMCRALVDSRPVKAVYVLATVGSKTFRGGEVVTSATGICIGGMDVARVGDLVRYPEGTESAIISGTGSAWVCDGKPVAIVGSHIENGDVIESSLQDGAKIVQFADEDNIPGLLEVGYGSPKEGE